MKKLTLLILSCLHFWSFFSCEQNGLNLSADVDLFADLDPYALNGKALVSNSEMPLLPEPANPINLAPITAIMYLKEDTQDTKQFACQHCTRIYKQKAGLTAHIKKEHSTESNYHRTWICHKCHSQHTTVFDLKSHQRTVHQKVFRFRCPHYKTCKYICAHMGDLNKHASRGPRDIYDKHIGKPDWKNIENEEGWS